MEEQSRVLVVDDDAYLRLLLSLEMSSVTILEASRIEDGYEVAMRERPDVVVVDRRLPDGDGLDLVRRLRANQALRRTPIIVVTAGFDESLRWGVLRAGADDYVAKPVDPEDLLARIRLILSQPPDQRRKRRAELAEQALHHDEDDPVPIQPAATPVPRPLAPSEDARGGLFRRRRD